MNNLFEGINKRESAVDIVVNNIKQLLIEKKIKPGDKLPSESEISEGLCVSRGSVREAMKILSAFGLVEVKAGNGTYISDFNGNSIMNSFLFSFFATNPNVENLYELRYCFEIDILELIIEHADQNQKERDALKNNLKHLEQLIKENASSRKIRENDLEFHRLFGKT
ncbi:MAG: GntR family transcriptional regulator, partial [Lachnospiraceae bacterium]|nr:GntR family transcriptional regulator [Lachnospiraceae bacterium]